MGEGEGEMEEEEVGVEEREHMYSIHNQTQEQQAKHHKKTYSAYHFLLQQTLLFGGHDKVVRVIPVVHNVLQIDARVLLQVLEELLVKNESHSTDLVAGRLLFCVVVHKVGSDGQRQLPPQLLPVEPWYTALLAVRTHQDVKVELVDAVLRGLEAGVPAKGFIWLQDLDEFHFSVNGDTKKQTCLEKDALESADTCGGGCGRGREEGVGGEGRRVWEGKGGGCGRGREEGVGGEGRRVWEGKGGGCGRGREEGVGGEGRRVWEGKGGGCGRGREEGVGGEGRRVWEGKGGGCGRGREEGVGGKGGGCGREGERRVWEGKGGGCGREGERRVWEGRGREGVGGKGKGECEGRGR